MGTASIHEGVRRMRFSSLLDRTEAKELTQEAASEMLGISGSDVSTVGRALRGGGLRWARAIAGWGGRRRSGRRRPSWSGCSGCTEIRTPTLRSSTSTSSCRSGTTMWLGYTVTKLALHAAGLVPTGAQALSAHRKKRPRRPLRGMMLHQDGSRHVWIEGLPAMDLIVTLDDATSEIYSMFLVEEEGTASTFQALREVIGEHGLFCSLYTDRGSHYFYTPKAGEKVFKDASNASGAGLIASGHRAHRGLFAGGARPLGTACSVRCRGVCRRTCGLPGSQTVEAANAWLKAHYIAEHNAAFAIKAEQEGTAFVTDAHEAWREALCVIEERTVANDNTIAWNGRRLQLPGEPAQAALRQGGGAGARVSRRNAERVPRPASAGDVRCRRQSAQPRRTSAWQRARALKDKPSRARKCASLTAPARAAVANVRVGTEKRASSRTKKLTKRKNNKEDAVALAVA